MNDIETHHARIREQYSERSGSLFYREVMGDGTPVIHYGIYESATTTMRAATTSATMRLLALASRAAGNTPWREIIDLGSGPGGSAHCLASHTNAQVTCVDLCEHHHRENQETAARLGIGDRIQTWHGSFERLPDDWTGRFDLAWSQEAFCHAADPAVAFQEAFRVLRPGGVLAFSDILLAEDASAEQAAAFRSVNAVMRFGTARGIFERLAVAGFHEPVHEDWSAHLPENFRRMLSKIEEFRTTLEAGGVATEHLDSFASSLVKRLSWPAGSVLCWNAFACVKPG